MSVLPAYKINGGHKGCRILRIWGHGQLIVHMRVLEIKMGSSARVASTQPLSHLSSQNLSLFKKKKKSLILYVCLCLGMGPECWGLEKSEVLDLPGAEVTSSCKLPYMVPRN